MWRLHTYVLITGDPKARNAVCSTRALPLFITSVRYNCVRLGQIGFRYNRSGTRYYLLIKKKKHSKRIRPGRQPLRRRAVVIYRRYDSRLCVCGRRWRRDRKLFLEITIFHRPCNVPEQSWVLFLTGVRTPRRRHLLLPFAHASWPRKRFEPATSHRVVVAVLLLR